MNKTGEPLPPATLLALAAGATSTIDTTIGDSDTANYRGDSCTSFEYVARAKNKRSGTRNAHSPNGSGKNFEKNSKANYTNIERSNSKASSNGTNGRPRRKLQSLDRKNKDKMDSSSEENLMEKEKSPKKEKSPNLEVKERSPSLDFEESRSRSASSGKSSKKDNSSQTEKRHGTEFVNAHAMNEEKTQIEKRFETESILDEQNLLKNMKEKSDCKKEIISLEELKNVNDALVELGQENLVASARDLTPLVLGRCVNLSPNSNVSLTEILRNSLERAASQQAEEQISREPYLYGKIKAKHLERKSSFTFKNKSEPVHLKLGSNSLDRKRSFVPEKNYIKGLQEGNEEELKFLLGKNNGPKSPGASLKLNRFLTIERKAAEQEQKLLCPSPELNSPVAIKKVISRENSFRRKERPIGFHEDQFEQLKNLGSWERKSPTRRNTIQESPVPARKKEETVIKPDNAVAETKLANLIKLKQVPPQVPPKPKKLLLKRDKGETSSDEDVRSPISVKEMAMCFSKASVVNDKFTAVLKNNDPIDQER